MKKLLYLFPILIFTLILSCTSADQSNAPSGNATQVALTNSAFNDYWYQGKAEVNTYALKQARYGEIREGIASLIFVTEDFSKSKHVKLDEPGAAGDDAVKILKLNKVKKFNTGLYPYSMMTSVFSPVNIQQFPHALKVTTSVQEWCGHVFMQLDNNKQGFQIQQFSYFESEGDLNKKRAKAWLEDELLNLLRINPEALPTGEIDIYPSQFYTRLKHRPYQAMKATAKLSEQTGNQELMTYELYYPTEKRTLKLNFDKQFPHRLQSWEETGPAGWGGSGEMQTTSGKRIETKMLAYWTMNSTKDDYMRKELLLE